MVRTAINPFQRMKRAVMPYKLNTQSNNTVARNAHDYAATATAADDDDH
jgi:hypothetical protein